MTKDTVCSIHFKLHIIGIKMEYSNLLHELFEM